MKGMEGAPDRQDPIKIVAYDPQWPSLFDRERHRVEGVLLPWLTAPVEHIGSTAVPGLAAKPIIDMLAVVSDYDAVSAAVPTMVAIGWAHAPEPSDPETRTHSFCHPDPAWRTHHLHVVEHSSAGWRTWLAFRDHLRANPADAEEYARLKQELAARDDHDRPAYRAGKAPFITSRIQRVEVPAMREPPGAES
ncbi:hypothetical protein Rhe02_27440 [Rhizocola hellebori]|uniref:GrpB family protein n=2 Tax=Rhizocola hellebori TaxID=1392758 RepID=A0A8J3VG24_9ACTN|nr:hypothetical protein Rhe02_27440 [Rhizocola hellebori]